VFSPNNDINESNEVFRLTTEGGRNLLVADPCNDFTAVKIYNRWGKLVYLSYDPNFEWDGNHYKNGNKCKPGTYYVVVFGEYGNYDETGERKYHKIIDQKYINLVR
jgi:flagellar hook assembly protein FlgD